MEMKTLLIVDDDKSILETMELLLSMEGYSCIRALTPEVAISLTAHEDKIDLALVDFLLAGEPCLPVLEVLDAKGIPYMIITAASRTSVLPHISKAKSCVSKPFKVEHLLSEISKCLNPLIKE